MLLVPRNVQCSVCWSVSDQNVSLAGDLVPHSSVLWLDHEGPGSAIRRPRTPVQADRLIVHCECLFLIIQVADVFVRCEQLLHFQLTAFEVAVVVACDQHLVSELIQRPEPAQEVLNLANIVAVCHQITSEYEEVCCVVLQHRCEISVLSVRICKRDESNIHVGCSL